MTKVKKKRKNRNIFAETFGPYVRTWRRLTVVEWQQAAGPIKLTAYHSANVTVACLEQKLELGLAIATYYIYSIWVLDPHVSSSSRQTWHRRRTGYQTVGSLLALPNIQIRNGRVSREVATCRMSHATCDRPHSRCHCLRRNLMSSCHFNFRRLLS